MSRLSAHDVQAVLDGVDLVGLVRGYAELRRAGRQWQGPCPFCLGGKDRFVVLPDKGRCFCRRCDFHGDAIEFVQRLEGLGWRQAVERLSGGRLPAADEVRRRFVRRQERERQADGFRQRAAAARLAALRAAPAAAGTPVEAYLAGRGLTVAVPKCLRFAERFDFSADWQGPAMLAAVRAPEGTVAAVHATPIRFAGDGRWTKAGVEPPRKVWGVKQRGAIRLTPLAPRLHLAEGIETALSVLQALGGPDRLRDEAAVWAAIDAGNLEVQPLPPGCREVVVWADRDKPDGLPRHAPDGYGRGERAARVLLDRAAAGGAACELKLPPARLGTPVDWNDVGQALAQERAA